MSFNKKKIKKPHLPLNIQQNITSGSTGKLTNYASVPMGNLGIIKDTKSKKETTTADLKEVASVIVTISKNESYDKLFRRLPQESEYGRVAIYSVTPGFILSLIQRALSDEIIDNFKNNKGGKLSKKLIDMLKQLKKDCYEAGADAVCFNFECCSGFTNEGFAGNGRSKAKDIYLDFITFLAKEFGCMTMFADFSLKALIKDWDEKRLGPNPFYQVGEFSGPLELSFDTKTLEKSPSAQLNTVGSLSENGQAKLKTMPATIAFSITKEAEQLCAETEELKKEQADIDHLERKYMEPYEVQVLTVASTMCTEGFTKNKIKEAEESEVFVPCEVNNKKGLAGHVLLTFPPSERNIQKYKEDLIEEEEARNKAKKEGKLVEEEEEEDEDTEISPVRGMFLVSCGHWIELMKIDVNMDRLLKTVETQWGETAEITRGMKARYASYTPMEQNMNSNADAVSYMQSKAPAKFNRKNIRRKKKGY